MPSTQLLIMHGALLAHFIVPYGLNIFDIKFRNLNADLTFGTAELSGIRKCQVVLFSLQPSMEVPLELCEAYRTL